MEFVLKSLGSGVSHYVHRWLMSHVSQVTLVSITGTCVQDSRCVVWHTQQLLTVQVAVLYSSGYAFR